MYSKYPGIKLVSAVWRQQENIENLSSYAHVVLTTAKRVISHCGQDENGSKMYRNENCRCKARKTTVFDCQLCQFVMFLLPLSSQLLELPTHILSTSNLAIAMLVTYCWWLHVKFWSLTLNFLVTMVTRRCNLGPCLVGDHYASLTLQGLFPDGPPTS